MSITQVIINNIDVTQYVNNIGSIAEYNDESFHFGGIFRFSNLQITLDNTRKQFNFPSAFSIFKNNNGRNNAIVELYYHHNDERIRRQLIFRGLIDEGSTSYNLKLKQITFTVMDFSKYLNDKVIKTSDLSRIDSQYNSLRAASSARLNKHYLASFLFFFLSQDDNFLNQKLNVFNNNLLQTGSYPNINASLESIFPPVDTYYNLNNISALETLTQLSASVNSFIIIENLENRTELHIKARPHPDQSIRHIDSHLIIGVENQTDGFNKLYNTITINNSQNYYDQDSIDEHGSRALNINSYAPASTALADSYLSYYSEPKKEANILLILNPVSLSYNIGDSVNVNVPDSSDYTVSELVGTFHVIGRNIDLTSEVVDLRLRQV